MSLLAKLYVVDVVDAQTPALAGIAGTFYTSPAESAVDALRLVRVLIGARETPAPTGSPWRRGIAGGVQTVTLPSAAPTSREPSA